MSAPDLRDLRALGKKVDFLMGEHISLLKMHGELMRDHAKLKKEIKKRDNYFYDQLDYLTDQEYKTSAVIWPFYKVTGDRHYTESLPDKIKRLEQSVQALQDPSSD